MSKKTKPQGPSARWLITSFCRKIPSCVPFVLSAMSVGLLFKLALYHQPNFNFVSTPVESQSKQDWNPVAKDPHSRHFILSSSENSKRFPVDSILEEKLSKEPWKDENRLMNLINFEWILNNKSICRPDPNASTDIKILPVLIHTARDKEHISKRKAIRKTLGSMPIYRNWHIRLIFLLGAAEELTDDDTSSDYGPEEVDNLLQEEQAQYGDLVMGNFPENSKTKTFKFIMGYKYILNFCQNAEIVMKVDHDKFVDIIKWLDWISNDRETLISITDSDNISLQDEIDDEEEENKVPDLYCNIFSGGKPLREPDSYFYASTEDWPEENFPDYCSSWAHAITVDLMKMIYAVTDEKSYFWIDDVYFGALLRIVKQRLKRKVIVKDCFKTYMGLEKTYRDICQENGKFDFDKDKKFGPVLDIKSKDFERDMMCLWTKVLKDAKLIVN